ncbi:MAG: toxin-antitoxin system YwqK family antitoxin, partial [Parachlamydiales bacterium]
MKKIFFSLFIMLISTVYCVEQKNLYNLKQREPNWSFDTVKSYPNGAAEIVVFYEPTDNGKQAVKQISFYENGGIKQEVDLTKITEEMPAFEIHKNVNVPSGTCLDFDENGAISKISNYVNGLLDGEAVVFYSPDNIMTKMFYKNGKLEGSFEGYYQDGVKKIQATHSDGKLTGEYLVFYPNGNKSAALKYKDGKLHGICRSWYESGAIMSEKRYKDGNLQGEEKNPALIVYDENHSIIETLDYLEGKPNGFHVKYFPN